jgi:Ca-activated chloride channel homolog
VTYANDANTDRALTSSYNSIITDLDSYTQALDGGGTNISDGINAASWCLANSPNARSFAAKVIVLMTDGKYNLGSNPKYTAEYVAQSGVMVFTVTFSQEADQLSMIETAGAGGGKHFHATSGSALVSVFEEIARSLPTLITQ